MRPLVQVFHGEYHDVWYKLHENSINLMTVLMMQVYILPFYLLRQINKWNPLVAKSYNVGQFGYEICRVLEAATLGSATGITSASRAIASTLVALVQGICDHRCKLY